LTCIECAVFAQGARRAGPSIPLGRSSDAGCHPGNSNRGARTVNRSTVLVVVSLSLAGCGSSGVPTTPTGTTATTVALKSYCAAQGRTLAQSAAAGVAAAYRTAAGGDAAAAHVIKTSTPELTQVCIDTAAGHKLGPNLTKSQIATLNADENN
jgi:hypothetical protein